MRCNNCGTKGHSRLVQYQLPGPGGAIVYDCHECYQTAHERRKVGSGFLNGTWVGSRHAEDVNRLAREPVVIQDPPVPMYIGPPVSCACCHVKAPSRYTRIARAPVPGNVLREQSGVLADLTGWLIMEFPFQDPRHPPGPWREGVDPCRTPWAEKVKVCPTCAPKVMATVKHLAADYPEEEL